MDRITRVLEAQGWAIVAVDMRGEFLQITAQKPKPSGKEI